MQPNVTDQDESGIRVLARIYFICPFKSFDVTLKRRASGLNGKQSEMDLTGLSFVDSELLGGRHVYKVFNP